MKKMTMLVLGGLLGLGLVFGSSASSNDASAKESPVQLEGYIKNGPYGGGAYVWKITAVEDGVYVKDLIINRGSAGCKPIYVYQNQDFTKRKLSFGDSLKFEGFKSSCTPLEVKIVTNKGEWVWDMRK